MLTLTRFAGKLALSALLILLPLSARAAVTSVGNITGVTVTTNSVNGNITASFALTGGGSCEITPFAPDVIRVDYHWVGPFETSQPMIDKAFTNWAATAATLTDQGTHYLLETSELDVEIEKSPMKVHFKDKSGYYLLQDNLMEFDSAYNYTGQRGTTSSKLKCQKVVPTDQAFFGLGEYGGPMNRRGKEIDCWNTGTYNWGEFTNPTYLNIPFMYGLQPANGGTPAFVYGLFFNNPCRPLFKFATQGSDKWSFEAGDGRLDYFFFGGGAGHTMPDVIDRYSELTGRPTMMPKWGLGHHLSRFSYSNQAWVEYIANQASVEDVPLDAVYLDIDYMDQDADNDISDGLLRQLTFNSSFANPAGMISYCAARGVNLIPLIEPWLEPGDGMYGEANSNSHFIKDNGGTTVTRGIYVGNVSWFDYTSTPMHDWWRGKILNWMSTLDFSGIWNDLTEPEGGDSIPHDALLWVDGQFGTSNTDSRRQWSNERNYFGLRCSKQSYNTMMAKDPNLRPFILSRSGNAGLQRYAVSWSGDTAANWFYHRVTLRFGMGAMISGVAWYGNDVGGFAGSPSSELMVRSTEANILTPFFRNHGDKSSADREPWRFSDPYFSHMRDLIKFRYKLMPYLYTLAYEATQTGEPMNVPPAFDFYTDSNTLSLNDYEWLVGDSILCAPVYNQGASSRDVYLPYKDGVEWYYWHDNAEHGGGQTVNVSAPLGTLPLFAKSGAIIPMGPSMQHANEFQPDWIDILCWPDGESEFTLHEDDGETWDYLGGEYARARMVSSRTEDTWNFTIEARQGSYDPGSRDYYVYCRNPGTSAIQNITLDGDALSLVGDFTSATQGWMVTAEGYIGIKVPDEGQQTAIQVKWESTNNALQFASASHSLSETNTFVRLYVDRSGESNTAVSVDFATSDGSATAGQDYTATNGTLNWAMGDGAQKFIDVMMSDDLEYDMDEAFTVTLSSPGGGANLGSPFVTTVTILENDPPPPELAITNPAMDITVGNAVTSYIVQGTAIAENWAGLVWSNSLTGDSGEAPIGTVWSISDIALGPGTNEITITATNVGTVGIAAKDHGTNTAYDIGWTDGDNGGSGWAGGWSLSAASNAGHFIASAGNDNNDAGIRSFGMWANNGDQATASRDFSAALAPGQVLTFRFDNNWIDNGSSVGFGLQNAAGENLLEFYFPGGESNYKYEDSSGVQDAGFGWSDAGWDITLELTNATDYTLDAGGNLLMGSLISQADQNIIRFRTWNNSAGTGSGYDYFFNNLNLTGGAGGPPPSTGDTVRITREDPGTQIPQAWRDRFNLTDGDQVDTDGDGLTNLEEYLADSNPTNGSSLFGFVALPGTGVIDQNTLNITLMGPTTNSRIYDLLASTNLNENSWLIIEAGRTGDVSGGSLIFTRTNNFENLLYFRTTVRP